MSAQHTPGPWSIHEHMGGMHVTECDGFVAHTAYFGAGDVLIGSVEAYQHEDAATNTGYAHASFDENEANARLIIAAPDLLDVVQRGRQKLATYTSVYPGDTELRKLLAAWDAAIARATGSAP